MIIMPRVLRRESIALQSAIWDMLQGHHPAAAADALLALLAHVVSRNARDPSAMMSALARNLVLAVDDADADKDIASAPS
jgi:hypothetical protein